MVLTLDKIQEPIAAEMREFEMYFREAMRSENKLLDRVTHYIIRRKGKQMRPMFVFLCSRMFGQATPSTYVAASLIELLHTATLVHDDVVDDAQIRRGFFSVNALWKNKIAVLIGDYLLARGLLMSVDNNEFKLLHIVSTAVREMSEGELLQQEKSRLLNISESVYFEIIRQKTASLIGACCAAGAAAANAGKEEMERMREFGIAVGTAFQIKDDLFDYGYGKDIGKATGIDIQEKKMTLPLIYALNNSDKSVRKRMIDTVKNHNTHSDRVKELIKTVRDSGGIEYAAKKMEDFREKALEILFTFPQNEARNSLEGLVQFTIHRDK
ncbi:MAG: polyprenyl synthetase family protein [Crocinitomicaceae bacterium]|nr:polyprenyl synthetase family protein [Crocinitomicaceae bacterium]